ncbi:MAG: YlmC/YmxH family sporulation protein [Clostridia bacterium]|jgi:YlmC/YmxH family sporulation protein|nr:YlmC/YmxH family sporulation protein [Clostridia bacterium]MDD4571466.1 YlmC/YmxH family sporulation protein [Clostridia bacterium]
MRLSELMGKRIVNIFDGDILGTVGDSDLVINPENGDIQAIILPHAGEGLLSRGERRVLNIPWSAVYKVGAEVIVVDLENNYNTRVR